MKSDVLGYQSPLYGRRTGQWKMNPLSFQYLHEFLPWDITDQVRANAALGGIPAYLHKFNRRLNFWKNISENILEKGTYVYSEAEILLNYEFREPANYMVLPGPMHQGKEA